MCSVRGIGRGRHGQHVHLLAHLLQPLFVTDAEALFFVDDQQAQVGELHVLREHAMRADQHIDLPGFRLSAEFPSAASATRKRLIISIVTGNGREALLEGLVMLERQHGGGREHGHLLVVAERLEGRAHGDFGLAVADIAA